MGKIISLLEALRHKANFFLNRPTDVNWILRVTTPDGRTQEFPPGTDWVAESKFGKVEDVMVTDENGNPLFNRPRYHEAPNVNVIAWGKNLQTGQIRVALLTEERPHALHPENPSSDVSLKFQQIPMGFLNKLLGKKEAERLESAKAGAIREVGEETGASAIIDVTQPPFPYHNPSPSFVATWSQLFFVRVDLSKIEQLKLERDEAIFRAEYVPLEELYGRIWKGQNEEGAILRGCTSLSLIAIFLVGLELDKINQT